MKFSLYSKKNQLDEMQEQTMRKIESHGFWLLWGSLLAAWIVQTVFGAAAHRLMQQPLFAWVHGIIPH